MANMMIDITQDGLQRIKENLKEALQRVRLLDKNKKPFYTAEITSIFYDANGVLTALFEVPFDLNLTVEMNYLQVIADNKIIAFGETPPITFTKGIGGVQTLKFPVSGEAGEVIFKANGYLTVEEMDELYMPLIIGNIASIQREIFKQMFKNIDFKKEIETLKEEQKEISGGLNETIVKTVEPYILQLFGLIAANEREIFKQMFKNIDFKKEIETLKEEQKEISGGLNETIVKTVEPYILQLFGLIAANEREIFKQITKE